MRIPARPPAVTMSPEQLAARAGGHVGVAEPITNSATRDRYLVRNLMEEAITSSQLESLGLLKRHKEGRTFHWWPTPDVAQRLEDLRES